MSLTVPPALLGVWVAADADEWRACVCACLLCPISWLWTGGPTMVADPQRLIASRLSPRTVRCPACGQERARAELVRKGQRLARCNACYRAERRAGRQRWEEHNRERRTRLRHGGGVACPEYVAWTVEAWPSGAVVVYGPRGRAWPEATVLPAYGGCSCGVAGCVHLVVACLAQQTEGGRDG